VSARRPTARSSKLAVRGGEGTGFRKGRAGTLQRFLSDSAILRLREIRKQSELHASGSPARRVPRPPRIATVARCASKPTCRLSILPATQHAPDRRSPALAGALKESLREPRHDLLGSFDHLHAVLDSGRRVWRERSFVLDLVQAYGEKVRPAHGETMDTRALKNPALGLATQSLTPRASVAGVVTANEVGVAPMNVSTPPRFT
jgi:hypothetical protein